MMNSDQLRALADALDGCNPYRDSSAVYSVAAYLRAQADAQPVAWRCEVRGDGTDPKLGAVDWRHYATTTNESNARAFLSRCGDGIEGRAVPLYPHPAPAVPQAEPCIGNDPICPCQDGDACHYKDSADGTKAWPVPQSEPKREPNPDEVICPACTHQFRAIPENVQKQLWAKREPLSDERITKGEYVFATKWDDGDPGDHWGVGFYDRFANGRHYVVDSAGKQIRGNGFRRVGRITVDVGRWLLSAGKSLEASPPGTVNLWTMLTERARRIGGSDAE